MQTIVVNLNREFFVRIIKRSSTKDGGDACGFDLFISSVNYSNVGPLFLFLFTTLSSVLFFLSFVNLSHVLFSSSSSSSSWCCCPHLQETPAKTHDPLVLGINWKPVASRTGFHHISERFSIPSPRCFRVNPTSTPLHSRQHT